MVLGIVVLVLLVLVGGMGAAGWFLMMPAIGNVRSAASRAQAQNNARQLSLALLNHESQHAVFPKSATTDDQGAPLLSWRVKILPYVESGGLYEQFHHDEPWDSPHNRSLISQMPPIFASPDVQLASGHTCWQAVVGQNSVIAKYSEMDLKGAPFPGVSPGMIRDGLSNTIMVVEVNPDRAVIWTKPDDFEYDPADPMRGLGSTRPGGFIAAYADGSARQIPQQTDPEMLRRLFDRNDAKPINLP